MCGNDRRLSLFIENHYIEGVDDSVGLLMKDSHLKSKQLYKENLSFVTDFGGNRIN